MDFGTGKRLSPEDSLTIWKEYRATGDQSTRDRLVLTFAPLVRYIVYKKIRELPASCEVDDFISCGIEALIGALDRYDPSKGATLEQFVWTRINGAVLDELRRQDWAPRSLRRWERDIGRARDHFASIHGRQPSETELADSVGTTVEDLRTRTHEIETSDVTSLNSLTMSDEQTTIERVETIAAVDKDLDPEHAAEKSAAKDRFRRAFERLPDRDREVAVLLYVKEMTLREIGDVLGVSESRVCQIHGDLKRKLRVALREEDVLFSEVA